jgi:hypothetical protein
VPVTFRLRLEDRKHLAVITERFGVGVSAAIQMALKHEAERVMKWIEDFERKEGIGEQ